MRKCLVAGNWKMHGSMSLVNDLLVSLTNDLRSEYQAEVVIFPPLYLDRAKKLLEKTGIKLGAQNCYSKTKGAYTEKSPP